MNASDYELNRLLALLGACVWDESGADEIWHLDHYVDGRCETRVLAAKDFSSAQREAWALLAPTPAAA